MGASPPLNPAAAADQRPTNAHTTLSHQHSPLSLLHSPPPSAVPPLVSPLPSMPPPLAHRHSHTQNHSDSASVGAGAASLNSLGSRQTAHNAQQTQERRTLIRKETPTMQTNKTPSPFFSESNFRLMCIIGMLLLVLFLVFSGRMFPPPLPSSSSSPLLRRSTPAACIDGPFQSDLQAVSERAKQWRGEERRQTLITSLSGRWIHFSGDSTMRMIYYEMINLLSDIDQFGVAITDPDLIAHRLSTRHQNQGVTLPAPLNIKLTFSWSPLLSNLTESLGDILMPRNDMQSDKPERIPSFIIASSGLWDLLYSPLVGVERIRYLSDLSRSLQSRVIEPLWSRKPTVWKERIDKIQRSNGADIEDGHGWVDWNPRSPTMLFVSSPSLIESKLTAHRLATPRFRNEPLKLLSRDIQKHYVANLPMLFGDSHPISQLRVPLSVDDGVHSVWSSAQMAASIAAFIECTNG